MQEELADDNTIVSQVAFEVADIFEAALPDFLVHQLRRKMLFGQQLFMYAHHQHFFIVGAIEDADASALGKTHGSAPEKIMVQLFCRWLLEAMNLAALRVHSGHYVLDQAVFAGGVHGLKDQEQGPPVLGIELFLQVGEFGEVLLENLRSFFLGFDFGGIGRVEILQAKGFAVVDFEAISELGHWQYLTTKVLRVDLPQRTPRTRR